MTSQITYEPIADDFPSGYTVEDLRNIYIKLRPLFTEPDRPERVIHIQNTEEEKR